jgi:hypothetical protein
VGDVFDFSDKSEVIAENMSNVLRSLELWGKYNVLGIKAVPSPAPDYVRSIAYEVTITYKG